LLLGREKPSEEEGKGCRRRRKGRGTVRGGREGAPSEEEVASREREREGTAAAVGLHQIRLARATGLALH